MLRKFALGTVLALAAGFTIGCDSGTPKPGDPKATGKSNLMAGASKQQSDAQKAAMEKAKEAGEKVKEGAEKVAEKASEGAEALKASTLKVATEKLEAIKGKLGTVTGDAGTKAKAAYDELTKLVDAFKAAPLDKIKDLIKPLNDKIAEVSKLVGIN